MAQRETKQPLQIAGSGLFQLVTLLLLNLLLFGAVSPAKAKGQPSRQQEPEQNEPVGAMIQAGDAQAGSAFGWTVAVSDNIAVVGAPSANRAETGKPAKTGAAYIFARLPDSSGWQEIRKLTASDGREGDLFGISVAISGETVAVSALWADGGSENSLPNAGAVYLFEQNQGGANNWGEVQKITASDPAAHDNFGRSVAIDGHNLIVGAPFEDGTDQNQPGSGAAYIFERIGDSGNGWQEVQKVTASDVRGNDQFGYAVAISGNTAAVGAYRNDGSAAQRLNNSGAVYLFEQNQGGAGRWGEVQKLTASDTQPNDWFGYSIAIDGNTLVAGAWKEDGPESSLDRAGAAYIFEKRGENSNVSWVETRKLTGAAVKDKFGQSVAVSGDTIIVGAPGKDGGAEGTFNGAGAAYIFSRHQDGPDQWGEVQKLTAAAPQTDGNFGRAVAADQNTVTVGAPAPEGQQESQARHPGTVYLYQIGLKDDDLPETPTNSAGSATPPATAETDTGTPTATVEANIGTPPAPTATENAVAGPSPPPTTVTAAGSDTVEFTPGTDPENQADTTGSVSKQAGSGIRTALAAALILILIIAAVAAVRYWPAGGGGG